MPKWRMVFRVTTSGITEFICGKNPPKSHRLSAGKQRLFMRRS